MAHRNWLILSIVNTQRDIILALSLRIPDENGQRSGGKTATIPQGKRPAFRLECGHHSGENGQYKMRV